MIGLDRPLALLLALPWLGGLVVFARVQARAIGWIDERISSRFRGSLTRYTRPSLRAHLVLLALMGLLAVLAAAGPHWLGRGRAVAERGRLLFLIDASASMRGEDVTPLDDALASRLEPEEVEPRNRLELARTLAREIAGELPGWQLALVSFSGAVTHHLPLTEDRVVFGEALRTLEDHSYYQNTGSNFLGVLDGALPFVDPRRPDLQILVLSDGEMPQEQDLDAPLEALSRWEVPVHALALGSLEGESRVIYDFRDVVAGKEQKRVLREFHTRREDRHLERMALETGGYFGLASGAALDGLLGALRLRQTEGATLRDPRARTDLVPGLLGVFLLLLLAETLWLGHGPLSDAPVFDVRRLGRPAGWLLWLSLPLISLTEGGCRGPVLEAHRENEYGIGADEAGLHPAARVRYLRSAAFGIDPEIPTFNRGRSLLLSGEWAEAHRVFQEALVLSPELARAHYNDGIALFRWGEAEKDPEGCHLERTRDLWQQSRRRFAGASGLLDPETPLATDARDNHRAVSLALAKVEALIENPPEACRQQSPEGGGASDGGEGTSGPSGGSEPPPPSPAQGGDTPGEPPPSPPGSQPPPPKPPPPGSGDSALSPDQLGQIRAELERIRGQGRGEGKFHRRTRPEQFGPEVWKNPEKTIWW